MKRLPNYLFIVISSGFFTIFLTLFTITSIIYLVKIAALTSIIKINFYELFLFYSYSLPNILFYTLPISLFAAIAIAFSKLSKEYELIVISSFGFNPLRFIKILFFTSFIASLALLSISLGLIPKTSYLNALLLDQKKKEANFNITASEFGQKFGKWLIFIENDDNKTFNNITLYKNDTDKNSESFIMAKTAKIFNNNGNLNLTLDNGTSFNIKPNEINQINFKQMILADSLKNTTVEPFYNSYIYWKTMKLSEKKERDFSFYALISLFPFVSLLLILSISYFNPRYEKNYSIFFVVAFSVAYYVISYFATHRLGLHAIWLVLVFWSIISLIFYFSRLKHRY